MKGRDHFTTEEAQQIRELLWHVRRAPEGGPQKKIRDGLRGIGFYISDWRGGPAGFTASDFDDLVDRGLVKIFDRRGERREVRARCPARAVARKPVVAKPGAATGGDDTLPAAAIAGLRGCRYELSTTPVDGEVPRSAGLYAIYGSAMTWRDLGLGKPQDDRPLYVGKAERSLVARDINTHFGDGRTGSSTVRRSVAGLLRGKLGLRGIPRNTDNPERPANFGLSPLHDRTLTAWMRKHLSLAVWLKPAECERLKRVEVAVLKHWEPPLNLNDVTTPWTDQVKDARKVMADDARAWARERGFAI